MYLKIFRNCFLFSLLVFSEPCFSTPLPEGLKSCGAVVASKAINGESFITDDGQTIKLAGIKAPELWAVNAPYNSWPFAEESRALLHEAVTGQPLHLYCDQEQVDIHGRTIAHVTTASGDWLQHKVVERGAAYVYPRRRNAHGINALYHAEDKARESRAGMWPRNAQSIASVSNGIRTGWFQIIRGQVLAANSVRKTIFLNFGEDWRTDFTVEISPKVHTAFKRANIDPISMLNKNVEVRGWVTWKGGPHIMLEGPWQIRLAQEE